MTLKLFAITLVLSVPLGLVLALLRLSRFAGLRALVGGYIWLMRGTPLMLQMLFIYFALPFVPVIGIRFARLPGRHRGVCAELRRLLCRDFPCGYPVD